MHSLFVQFFAALMHPGSFQAFKTDWKSRFTMMVKIHEKILFPTDVIDSGIKYSETFRTEFFLAFRATWTIPAILWEI